MNYQSHADDVLKHPDWNQNPQALCSDATTRADLNGLVNLRAQRESESDRDFEQDDTVRLSNVSTDAISPGPPPNIADDVALETIVRTQHNKSPRIVREQGNVERNRISSNFVLRTKDILVRYAQFVGPGFLIAVAYIDPGNYATDVQAGAKTRYAHLFIVLMANLFAVFLQSLCIKLGSVTGLNLAENCRKHLPKWLNILLYVLAEAAIVATDIAEVIGSAIALNLLFHIPLVAGCAITLVDVFILLLFWNQDGSMARLRIFEYFVMALVMGVVICFSIQLSYIQHTTAGEVFRGYIPSAPVIENNGIYLSCGILGATVMPHSMFLGSGVVTPRLKQFDERNGFLVQPMDSGEKYRPSIHAIRSCLKFSIVELATSLFTFALFVNSAILIVAGSSLYPSTTAANADLFSIHDLLSHSLSKAAATIFALALLLSGTSAGIVCTMAGQMVSEGMLNWKIAPWKRRLVTRTISILPSIVIAAAVGKNGIDQALNATQVVLSVILPFVTAPLLWFTCQSKIMSVQTNPGMRSDTESELVNMRNGWVVTSIGVLIWVVLAVMNIALLVLVGLGKA